MDMDEQKQNRRSAPGLKYIAQISVSLICLGWVVYLLSDMDWQTAHSAFKEISMAHLFFSLLFVVLLYLSRLVRLRFWILKIKSSSMPGMDWMVLYFKSVAFGAITPARLGDFSRIHLLSPTGITLVKRSKIVVVEKIWDMTYAPMAILISSAVLNQKFQIPALMSVLTAGLLLAASIILIYRLGGFLGARAHGAALVLTLAGFLCYILSNVFLFQSVGIDLAIVDIVAITTAMGVMASIPVSLGGLGIREGMLLLALQLWGVPREMALPLIYLEFFVNIIFPILLYLPMRAVQKKTG